MIYIAYCNRICTNYMLKKNNYGAKVIGLGKHFILFSYFLLIDFFQLTPGLLFLQWFIFLVGFSGT